MGSCITNISSSGVYDAPLHWPCVKPSAYSPPYRYPIKIHTHARQCPAPPPTPLPLPLPPPPFPPALIPLPRSRSACSFATAPDPPPCPHPSHHTPSLTRLVRYLQVQGSCFSNSRRLLRYYYPRFRVGSSSRETHGCSRLGGGPNALYRGPCC